MSALDKHPNTHLNKDRVQQPTGIAAKPSGESAGRAIATTPSEAGVERMPKGREAQEGKTRLSEWSWVFSCAAYNPVAKKMEKTLLNITKERELLRF